MSKYEKLEPVFAELDSGDEHIHPMFNNELFPDEEQPRKKMPVLVIGSLLIVAFLGGGLVFAYKQGVREGNRSAPPVITASKKPIKVAPVKRGGINIPNQDKRVYDRLDKKPVKVTERLLPAPEEIMDLPQKPKFIDPPVEDNAGTGAASPDVPYAPEVPDVTEKPLIAPKVVTEKIMELKPPVQAPAENEMPLPTHEVDVLTITPDGVFQMPKSTPVPTKPSVPAPEPTKQPEAAPEPAKAPEPVKPVVRMANIPPPPIPLAGIPELEDGKTMTERLLEADRNPVPPVTRPVNAPRIIKETASAAKAISPPQPLPAPQGPVAVENTDSPMRVAGLPPIPRRKPALPASLAKPQPTSLVTPPRIIQPIKRTIARPVLPVTKPVAGSRVNTGRYVVQIASHRKQVDALAEFSRLQRRYPQVVGNYKPSIQRADLGERGVYYRLRIGAMPSKADAARFCEELKAAGKNDCLVRRR